MARGRTTFFWEVMGSEVVRPSQASREVARAWGGRRGKRGGERTHNLLLGGDGLRGWSHITSVLGGGKGLGVL